MIFAQVTNEQIANGAVIGGGLVVAERLFSMYAAWAEKKDRKIMREEAIKQTEILHNIQSQQVTICKYKE